MNATSILTFALLTTMTVAVLAMPANAQPCAQICEAARAADATIAVATTETASTEETATTSTTPASSTAGSLMDGVAVLLAGLLVASNMAAYTRW